MTWVPVNAKDAFYAKPSEATCPSCGCPLSFYEIFACRLRGLKRPVCVGCLADNLVTLRDHILPMLDGALEALGELAEKTPEGGIKRGRAL